MLTKLVINNYAIIEHLTIEPDDGLNTVTGETGAGKSIILGALSLILGERADTSVLINKDEKCIVEAFFDVSENDVFRQALAEYDLDNEPVCIIRREIHNTGKSRAFVNDTPVTLNVVNVLTSLLVDLHRQLGHLALEDDNFQVDVLDAIAQNGAEAKSYRKLYERYTQKKQELSILRHRQAAWQKEADYKQYLYDELVEANFKNDEIEQLGQQLKQLTHAERVLNVLQGAQHMLAESEQPVLNELKKVMQQLQGITDILPYAAVLVERLSAVLVELKDIAGELKTVESKVVVDERLVQQLQERVDVGYKLFKKHGVMGTYDLLAIQKQLEEELSASHDLSQAVEATAREVDMLYSQVLVSATGLSEKRKQVTGDIADRVNELLALVGMPNACLEINIKPLAQPQRWGIDDVQFLLDANKSGQFLPVYKAASGGEMSRIMLCIKTLTAKAIGLPTLIFDEVDTGISGEAAKQVAVLLKELGQYHQVICITHQPQVAAKGSRHFYVYKEVGDNSKITTKIRVLKEEERVAEIAKMIGGEQPSDAAVQNAKELVMI